MRRCTRITSPAGLLLPLVALFGSVLLVPTLPGDTARAQERASKVRVWEGTITLPTYREELPDPNPPFDLFTSGRFNYPYTIRDRLTDRREPREWRALFLENEYLKAVVLPDLGGHLYSSTDKRNGAQMFYANPSIKLASIAYRGAWAALGIEFNFPVSHNWMTTSPVDFAITENEDGSASIWVGNIDRVYGMQWGVELRMRPGRAVLEQHTTLYNRSDFRHRFYWWTNAAVEVWDDSRIIYPMRFTASHGFRDIDTWPVNAAGVDLSVVGNHRYGPVSRFSYGSREPWMAVYHPRTGAGVVHYASPTDLPAKKIWSWGGNADGLDWRRALSDDFSAYVEIQAGLFRDQETYGFLEPHDAIRFSEYWMPIRELGTVSSAVPDAIAGLSRRGSPDGTITLEFGLNVLRSFKNATIRILDGERIVAVERRDLGPEETFTSRLTGLPAGPRYTLELLDAGDRPIVAHTEDAYDFTPAERIDTGPRPPIAYPGPSDRSEGDWLALGADRERNGDRLRALETYRNGLERYPRSIELHKAAGRLGVVLKQFETAAGNLRFVLERVSNDYEAAYYLGHALEATGEGRGACLAWESAQRYGTWRPAALFALAALTAREGDREGALSLLAEAAAAAPHPTRAGGMQVALLRALRRPEEASERLAELRRLDPTSSFLRHEAVLLGTREEALRRHLAADPERILEIVVDYTNFGLYGDALRLLEQRFPAGGGVITEPGMPHPDDYPLIAYYRGWCREMLGRDGGADYDAASRMPTTYVFPNRPETFAVLRGALTYNPEDATARFLLGALYLSGGMVEQAMEEWETVRRLKPETPALHRNMGYTVLRSGGPPERAAALFREGTTLDPYNVGLYFGLEEAMSRAGASAGERADALLTYPDPGRMPAALVYRLARLLAEAGRFDEAEALFRGRFFPRREGGVNVREVYLEVRLSRALALAKRGEGGRARAILSTLGDAVEGLPFTRDGLEAFIESRRFQERIEEVRRLIGPPPPVREAARPVRGRVPARAAPPSPRG